MKPCKDCVSEGITTERKIAVDKTGKPYPGPRCVTHHRLEKKRKSKAAHAKRTEANFGLDGDEYWDLHAWQGGLCWICRRSTGAAKRLAVDHDHGCDEGHPPERGCRECVRALLCGPCNQQIGWWNVDALYRAIEVLTDPPAQRFLEEQEDAGE